MAASAPARYVRTTVKVREDLHEKAKRRGMDLSETLNETLEKRFAKPKGQRHPLHGSLKGLIARKDWAELHREAGGGHEW